MSEFKGTKGKWGLKGKYSCTFIDIWFGDNFQCKSEHEALYNALLISKAPEMLEMLKKLTSTMDYKNIEEAKQLIKEATEL